MIQFFYWHEEDFKSNLKNKWRDGGTYPLFVNLGIKQWCAGHMDMRDSGQRKEGEHSQFRTSLKIFPQVLLKRNLKIQHKSNHEISSKF